MCTLLVLSISTETPVPQITAAPADDKLGNALEALATARESGQTQRDANAQHKLKVAPKQDGGTLSDGHECLLFQEPVKFKVLAPCTVRQGLRKMTSVWVSTPRAL